MVSLDWVNQLSLTYLLIYISSYDQDNLKLIYSKYADLQLYAFGKHNVHSRTVSFPLPFHTCFLDMDHVLEHFLYLRRDDTGGLRVTAANGKPADDTVEKLGTGTSTL